MSELTWIVDPLTGSLMVEGLTNEESSALIGDLLPPGRALYCAVPLTLLHLPPATPTDAASSPCVRVAGYYHDSLIEGPGRRSVAKFQGCPLRCAGFISSMIAAEDVPASADVSEVISDGTAIRVRTGRGP